MSHSISHSNKLALAKTILFNPIKIATTAGTKNYDINTEELTIQNLFIGAVFSSIAMRYTLPGKTRNRRS